MSDDVIKCVTRARCYLSCKYTGAVSWEDSVHAIFNAAYAFGTMTVKLSWGMLKWKNKQLE